MTGYGQCAESRNEWLILRDLEEAATVPKQSKQHKRPLSYPDYPAKRRKSVVQHQERSQFPNPNAPTVKDETNTESEDEQDDPDEIVGTSIVSEEIRIGDAAKVWEVIDSRLRQMKQVHCKTVARTWVKAKEPLKQTQYPYNGGATKEESIMRYGNKMAGELTKPPWWCVTQGWQRGEGCRHKEPDHQKKPGT